MSRTFQFVIIFATDRFVSNIINIFGTCWNHLDGNILTLYKHQLPQAPLYQSY